MTPFQALLILAFASILAFVFYYVGKKSAEKNFSQEIDTFRRAVEADVHRISAEHIEEVRYAVYCQGVQDADNWWIRTEEESESFFATKHGSVAGADRVPTRNQGESW